MKTNFALKTALLYGLVISSLVGFFGWLPDKQLALELRQFGILGAGLFSFAYLVFINRMAGLSKTHVLLLGFFILSSVCLLLRSPVQWALFGYPTVHPGILSLSVSLTVGILFVSIKNQTMIFRIVFYLIAIFGLLNILYMAQVSTPRLGEFGLQINYVAYLFLCATFIGNWLINKSQEFSLIAGQAFIFLCLYLTLSRTAISLAVPSLVFFIYQIVGKAKFSRLTTICLLIIGCFGVSLFLHDRISSIAYLNESFAYRKQLAAASLPSNRADLILGGGIGSIEHNISENGGHYSLLKQDIEKGWLFESSHNYFIDVLVERGALTLLLLLAFIILAIKNAFKNSQDKQRLLLVLLLSNLVFLQFNNINIQQEIVLWACIVSLLLERTLTKKQSVAHE